MKAKKQIPHICKYTKTSKALETLFPPNKKFYKIRRKFREFLLVSEENGRRRGTPQSTSGYLFEKEKQLTQYYYMIHPYSKFRQYWELTMIVEILVLFTVRTFVVSQFQQNAICDFRYQIPCLFVDLFEMTDVGLLFLTGYIDREDRGVVFEIQKVFFREIQNCCFYINVINSFPLEFLVYLININNCDCLIAKFVIFVKITKLGTLTRYLIHISQIYNWSELSTRLVWIIITLYLITQCLSCLFFLIVSDCSIPQNIVISDSFYKHFTVFYMVSSVFFLQNGLLPYLSMKTLEEKIFTSFILITSVITTVVLIGLLIQLSGLVKSPVIHYQEMIQEVEKFLTQENLPKHIHIKVLKYFEFRFRCRYFPEKLILETLSPPLRQEIANFLCMNLLLHPDSIFADLPIELASALCLKMKLETYLPGDAVYESEKKANRMYFVFSGTLAMYSTSGMEITHLFQGQQTGEETFIEDKFYKTTVLALEISECYYLTRRDFLHCLADYPEYKSVEAQIAGRSRIALYKIFGKS